MPSSVPAKSLVVAHRAARLLVRRMRNVKPRFSSKLPQVEYPSEGLPSASPVVADIGNEPAHGGITDDSRPRRRDPMARSVKCIVNRGVDEMQQPRGKTLLKIFVENLEIRRPHSGNWNHSCKRPPSPSRGCRGGFPIAHRGVGTRSRACLLAGRDRRSHRRITKQASVRSKPRPPQQPD